MQNFKQYFLKENGLAEKEGTSARDVNSKELAMGIKVEQEHTSDKNAARRIALDHLTEDPKYYTKLKKMEAGECD